MKRKLLLAFAILITIPLLIELGFMLLKPRLGVDEHQLKSMRDYVCDGRLLNYVPHPYTVYSKPINTQGFNDDEWTVERTPGVPRIVCMGGSTTEGGNSAGQQGSYPHFLRKLLEEQSGRGFEVYNAGMSSWTSAEILISWFLQVQDYQPDLLVIHCGINDSEPRAWPGFRRDYSHFRHPLFKPRYNFLERTLTRWSDFYAWMELRKGVPDIATMTRTPLNGPTEFFRQGGMDPATTQSFRRNLESIGDHATSRGIAVLLMTAPMQPATEENKRNGGHYLVGVLQHNEILRELAAEKGWLLADAAQIDQLDTDKRNELFITLAHVSPDGNRMKAQYILDALNEDWPSQLGFLDQND